MPSFRSCQDIQFLASSITQCGNCFPHTDIDIPLHCIEILLLIYSHVHLSSIIFSFPELDYLEVGEDTVMMDNDTNDKEEALEVGGEGDNQDLANIKEMEEEPCKL